LAGGVFGVLVLIRIETLAMIPAFGLMGLFYYRRQWLVWLRGVGMAGLSIIIMVTPWMIRNYQVEGVFGLDKSYYIQWHFNRYMDFLFPNGEGNEDSKLPGENQFAEISAAGRNAVSTFRLPDSGQSSEILTESPTPYLLDHFINSIEQTVYYLPNNHQPLLTIGGLGTQFSGADTESDLGEANFLEDYLDQYVKGLPYWRYDWDGKLVARSYLPILITIALISYGLSLLKKDRIWIPVLFLLMILTQSAVYAILSGSGGRYIVIVDWIPLLFYGIGLSGVVSKGFLLVNGPEINDLSGDFSSKVDPINHTKKNWRNLAVLGGVLAAGLILPLSEVLIPSPFTEAALEKQIDILKYENNIDLPLENKRKEVILYGKALYPRFFEAGDRMEDDRKGTIPDYSYQRVEFYLVGTQNAWVTLPLGEVIEYFPHGSEILIVADIEKREFSPDGQKIHGRYYKAKAIYILNADPPSNFPIPLVCSGEECVLDVYR